MPFYTLVSISTALIVLLTYSIWRKTRAVVFPLGALCLYFWSLHGAWGVIFDKSGGDSGLHYHYLESKLFPISLNENYFLSITYYAFFCIIVLLMVLVLAFRNSVSRNVPFEYRPPINHPIIIASAIICGLLSYALIADVISQAAILGQAGYTVVMADKVRFYSIHQIFTRGALILSFSGLAVILCRKNSLFFDVRFRIRYLVTYVGLVAVFSIYAVILGAKNALLGAFLTGGLIYLAHNSAPKTKAFMVLGVVALMAIGSIDYLRGFALLSTGTEGLDIDDLLAVSSSVFLSNEAFSAHFSMYGVLEYNIQPTLGADIAAFVLSIVPSFFWPGRPVGVYENYVAGVYAVSDQGYTIHHASAWYLDFGLPGVVIGAIVLGWLWVYCYNRFVSVKFGKGRLGYVFWTIAPFALTAYFPNLIRTGVTGYKGLAVDALILPVLVFYIATKRRSRVTVM